MDLRLLLLALFIPAFIGCVHLAGRWFRPRTALAPARRPRRTRSRQF